MKVEQRSYFIHSFVNLQVMGVHTYFGSVVAKSTVCLAGLVLVMVVYGNHLE